MPRKIEWSDKNWKKLIIEQRKRLWLPDTIEKLAKWLDLKPGMKVVDIGCGLGYLGWTYWKYFGENGSYTGIDISEKLIKEAEEISEEWVKAGKAEFLVGDVYNLQFEDNTFDVVMCQTLLMHLAKPEKAISEMFRILKPGGTILCKEPDNYSNGIIQGFSTLPDAPIEEQLVYHKIRYYLTKGRKKMNQGDNAIGNKLPMLLHKAGFIDIDIRGNDQSFYMIPPYELDFQKTAIQNLHKRKTKTSDNEQKFWQQRMKEQVLAGGGTEYLLRKYFTISDKRSELNRKKAKNQIKKNELFSCYGPGSFYAAKGSKEHF
jgi:ubiquinone/menaquinone biosynthesis C-methylase UbiE